MNESFYSGSDQWMLQVCQREARLDREHSLLKDITQLERPVCIHMLTKEMGKRGREREDEKEEENKEEERRRIVLLEEDKRGKSRS